jgi:hypothetical protein
MDALHQLMNDHAVLISTPPKYSVAQVIGCLKGKGGIWIEQNLKRLRNLLGHKFSVRSYFNFFSIDGRLLIFRCE